MFHSAEWEWDFDFSGKKVAVVGSGCSERVKYFFPIFLFFENCNFANFDNEKAVQIVPELAKSCSEVHMFQRSASPILEKWQDGKYSPESFSITSLFKQIKIMIIYKKNLCSF